MRRKMAMAPPMRGQPSSERGEGPAAKGTENQPSPSKQNEQARPPTPSPLPPPDPAKPYPTMSEQELFSDPRASLDKIAGAPPPGPRIDPSATLKGYGEVGPSADEALRDPFRPLGSDGRSMWSRTIRARRRRPLLRATSRPPLSTTIAPGRRPCASRLKPERAPQGPGAGSPAPSTASAPAPDPAVARQTAASNLLADLNKRLAGEFEADAGAATRRPGDGRRNPHQPHRSAKFLHVRHRLRRAATPRPAHDGGHRREPAKFAGRHRRARAHRRPSLPVRHLRQLAALLGARANGLLHADSRRPAGKAVRAGRRIRRPSSQGRCPIPSRPKIAASRFSCARPSHDFPACYLALAAFAALTPTAAFADPPKISDLVDELRAHPVQDRTRRQGGLPGSAHSVEDDRRGDRDREP